YVYTSNETQQDVFFDNVTVALAGTPVLEETHYYPFGLTMAGLSEKQVIGKFNNFKFNGKELQTGEFTSGPGLEMYDYGARFYDVQVGRWNVYDPKLQYASPYVAMGNRPINGIDFDGKYFWEKKHIRQARQYARQIGGEFHKYKGSDGKNWASVQDKSGYITTHTDVDGNTSQVHNVTTQVFRPGSDRSALLLGTGNSTSTYLANSSGLAYVKIVTMLVDDAARGKDGQLPGLVKAVAGANPLFGIPNSINVLYHKKDLFGMDASSKLDQTLAKINIVSGIGFGRILGAGAKGIGAAATYSSGLEATATAAKVLDWTNYIVQGTSDAGWLDYFKTPQPEN
ncbi:RHS repeat-associated core domain-containing protein, partial [Chitinophaga rhizosphaerae]|uniref:RHS repeat-associated core domain-containing protein n=1 Tax=Chitinophaga rhizosphaerae TaxID=1864947 RepID=UPI002938DDF4